MSRRSAPCADCGRLIRARHRLCWACYIARRTADAERLRAACRLCGVPLDGGKLACRDCADAYWRSRRALVRLRQQREGCCYACGAWFRRATPGRLFCGDCSTALDAITAGVAALYAPTGDRLAA